MSKASGMRIGLGLALCLATACAEAVPGTSPPLDSLHFPLGMTLVAGATTSDDYLVLCNSEFDQRYNAGSLMSLNVDQLFDSAANADLENPSTELPIADVVRIPLLCGDLAYQPRFDDSGNAAQGRGRLFATGRLERALTTVEFENGAFQCKGTGAQNTSLDCSDGFIVGTENPDPFTMTTTPPINGAPQGLLAVGHFGNRAFPAEVQLYDIDRLDRRGSEDASLDPLVHRERSLLDGVSGLTYVPGPAIDAPLGTFVALALDSGREQGVPLGTYELERVGDGFTLAVAPRVSALDIDDLTGGAGLTVSGDGTRIYASVRIPEATREQGGQDRYNSAIIVVAIEDERVRFISAFEVGEELGRPALLERDGRRLIYVPDHRFNVIWVLDATRDALAVVQEIRGIGSRMGPDGAVRTHLLATPASIVFAQRGDRTLGFVSNFSNSTLAILDVSDADPAQHRVVARLGQDIDAFGESELEQ